MALSALATAAVAWLVKAFRSLRKRRVEMRATIAAIKALGFNTESLEKFFNRLMKVEQTHGAHTSAWARIDQGAEDKSEVTLTVAEVRYLNKFKDAFDKYLKKPFKK